MQSPYLSKFGRKLKAIRDISVPNTVGPTVDTFCTAVKEAEASAKAQNFFHWNEQNPQHRAILAELDAVCDKLQAFTRSHSSDANDADMDCDKVNEFLVRLGVLTSSNLSRVTRTDNRAEKSRPQANARQELTRKFRDLKREF
jgi:hypothetical protein